MLMMKGLILSIICRQWCRNIKRQQQLLIFLKLLLKIRWWISFRLLLLVMLMLIIRYTIQNMTYYTNPLPRVHQVSPGLFQGNNKTIWIMAINGPFPHRATTTVEMVWQEVLANWVASKKSKNLSGLIVSPVVMISSCTHNWKKEKYSLNRYHSRISYPIISNNHQSKEILANLPKLRSLD